MAESSARYLFHLFDSAENLLKKQPIQSRSFDAEPFARTRPYALIVLLEVEIGQDLQRKEGIVVASFVTRLPT